MSSVELLAELGRRHIPVNYDVDDLRTDLKTLSRNDAREVYAGRGVHAASYYHRQRLPISPTAHNLER